MGSAAFGKQLDSATTARRPPGLPSRMMVTIACRKRVIMSRMHAWYQTEEAEEFRMLAEFAYHRPEKHVLLRQIFAFVTHAGHLGESLEGGIEVFENAISSVKTVFGNEFPDILEVSDRPLRE